jgi:hypothetical protein
MNSKEIGKICHKDKQMRKSFLGVFASDELPEIQGFPACFIANTKPKTHTGEHWVAIYIDESLNGTYFCSFGRPPTLQFKKYMINYCDSLVTSNRKLQSDISTTCGQFCVFYLHFRCRSINHVKSVSLLSSTDYVFNDQIVTCFINGFYDVNTDIINKSFFNYDINSLYASRDLCAHCSQTSP